MEDGGISEFDDAHMNEARALVGILGALSGLDALPPVNPDSDPVPLVPIQDSVNLLRDAEHLPGPVRLELLARLVYARSHDHAALRDIPLDLGGVSRKLMKDDQDAGLGNQVIQLLERWSPGIEPLGRMSVFDFENFSLRDQLLEDIACTALIVKPGCGAVTTSVNGIQALSVVTEVLSCKKFDKFETLVNPKLWTSCWLQNLFFRSMNPAAGSVLQPLDVPDGGGWRQNLTEVVDFSLGALGNDSLCLTTELDVTYFCNGPGPAGTGVTKTPPAVSFVPGVPGPGPPNTPVPLVVTRSPVAAAGCTYDLRSSVNNQILVDQGFLLVEEIPGRDLRRYRTQKEIYFSFGNLPPEWVCEFWSLASGLIMQGC